MEIVAAGLVFFITGLSIGIVFGRLKYQNKDGQLELLFRQNEKLTEELRSQDAMLSALEPLRQQVETLAQSAQQSERAQTEGSIQIREQLNRIAEINAGVETSTKQLSKVLTQNTERGRWGEIQLSQIMQASGLLLGTNFVTQKSFSTTSGDVRPDCVVFLPDGSKLVIDSKVPFNKLLESFDATDEQTRKLLLKEHADAVLLHAKSLVDRDYHKISNGLEFVIMFFPFESILSAATEGNDAIISDLAKLKILPATPSGIIGLINLIGYVWRQDTLARNTIEISRLASIHLDHLNAMFSLLKKTRKSFSSAIDTFNQLVRRFENSVLQSANDLRDLGVAISKPLPEAIDPIERSLREIDPAEVSSEIEEIEPEQKE